MSKSHNEDPEKRRVRNRIRRHRKRLAIQHPHRCDVVDCPWTFRTEHGLRHHRSTAHGISARNHSNVARARAKFVRGRNVDSEYAWELLVSHPRGLFANRGVS